MYICTTVCKYACMYVHTEVVNYMYACMYDRTYVCIIMHVCTTVCLYVSLCMCIRMYVHTINVQTGYIFETSKHEKASGKKIVGRY